MQIKLNETYWTSQPKAVNPEGELTPPRQIKVTNIFHKNPNKEYYEAVELNAERDNHYGFRFFDKTYCYSDELFKYQYDALIYYQNYLYKKIIELEEKLKEIAHEITDLERDGV